MNRRALVVTSLTVLAALARAAAAQPATRVAPIGFVSNATPASGPPSSRPTKELPMEQPMKFERAISLESAAALGLTVPPSVRLQADQVVE
jgi:hypothetical protein